MHRTHKCSYSPLRAKRRQSDAKWRASVATCYDALKYVVPNVEHLSKRKISKALILQESENHIKDLETAISYLLNVESESKGKKVLWQEGDSWSQCTLEKLRSDFSEKQQKIFQSSTQGRRCYNLLHDIKEDVFSMQVDSQKLAFIADVRDFSNDIVNAEDVDSNEVITAEGDAFQKYSTGQSTTETKACFDGKTQLKEISRFSQLCLHKKQTIQIRQQPPPTQRITRNKDKSCSSYDYLTSPSEISQDEQPQTVPIMRAGSYKSSYPASSGDVSIKVSASPAYKRVPSCSHSDAQIKVEHVDKAQTVSNNVDYTYLLKTLEEDREQEVPTMLTPIKPTNDQHFNLIANIHKRETEEIKILECGNRNIQEYRAPSFFEVVVSDSKTSKYHGKDIQNYRTPEPSSDHSNAKNETCLSSPANVFLTHIKKEILESSTPVMGRDPLLSSSCTPKAQKTPQFVSNFDTDLLIKRPAKFCTAKKKLNFNVHPQAKISSHSSLLSPDRVPSSSPLSGFTPVKLPDDFCHNSVVSPAESFISPWKTLNSPFDLKSGCQSFTNSAPYGFDDSLLCLESIDSGDVEEENNVEITPARHSEQGKSELEDRCKRKLCFRSPPCHGKQPKCRRKLESFYDNSSLEIDHTLDNEINHVVPQMKAELPGSDLNDDWDTKMLTCLKKENQEDNAECSDFDDIYMYYCQVSHQLKGSNDCQKVPPSVFASKVVNLWTKLTDQEKITLTTLAHLEHTDSDSCGKLSQDLEEVEVEPLDPQEFIQSLDV